MFSVFALHYFLWFAALTPIYGYVSVYAGHYAGTSSSQYGLLNMVLPFASIFAKLYFCSLADRHQAHRSLFIWFLFVSFIGFGSYAILPLFIGPRDEKLGLDLAVWAIICVIASISNIAMGVMSCLSDAYAVNSSRLHGVSYGQIRLWGTLGWGLGSLLVSFINQIDALPFLLPGLMTTAAFMSIDLIIVVLWRREDFILSQSTTELEIAELPKNIGRPGRVDTVDIVNPVETNNDANSCTNLTTPSTASRPSDAKLQWIVFKEVIRTRKSIIRYLLIFVTSGALISLQWSYFFLYLERVYKSEFAFTSGISMVSQSLLGELPFFLFSDRIVKILGRSHTLTVSLMTLGIRYLLYEYLLTGTNLYYVLLTEAFQGPSFGLFYVVMTEVGLDYSDCEEAVQKIINKRLVPNCSQEISRLRLVLRATMQSLMSACYEGFGLGIGSIIGGLVIDYYDFSTLWTGAAAIALFLGITNLIIDVLITPRLSFSPSKLEVIVTNDNVHI